MTARRRHGDLDEDDVRIRPARRTRPRTKDRPRHADAGHAMVLAVDRGRYACLLGDTAVLAMKARELGRQSVVVGDRVRLVGDTSGDPGSLARIVRVEPRRSVLRRSADDADPVERALVANADQLVVVVALAEPAPQPRLVDRCLVAAYDAGLDALLCLTKPDLHEPAELLASYAAVDVGHVVVRRGGDLEPLRARLHGRTSVLVGSSGVGKSTLVNALVPGTDRATGGVNLVTGRGRHTSSSAVALRLPGGAGWVVDTPGVRSFGLGHVRLPQVVAAFPDLLPGAAGCPRGCSHDEPECELDAWVAAGHADAARLASLRRLLRSRQGA
jgi:ribosome biogenesis GTPase / thiamine phosphate phosphatase